MWSNLQIQNCNKEHLLMASRKEAELLVMVLCRTLIPIVEDCISKMGIHFVQQVIGPIMDDSIRKVKPEIELAVRKMLVYQNRNSVDATTTSIPRDYKLKFLDTLSDPVYTGMEIKGKNGTDIKVALVDNETEYPVDSGPESSATVEILFLDGGVEDFNNSIIKANNNPHFPKPIHVHLEKGIGILPKTFQLGHNSQWLYNCKCKLGARVEQKFDGSRIKEASTESFTVSDRRSILYRKHDQPILSDEVWRLNNIAKNGARHNRLRDNNIYTVQDFLGLLRVDPQRLKKIFGAGQRKAWSGTVDHALKCYFSSSKCIKKKKKNGVVFDVEQQKEVLPDYSCVPIESVAESEKDDAWKSLAPTFENQNELPAYEIWNNMASVDDEASFLHNFPSTSNDKNVANSTGLDGHSGQYLENWDAMTIVDDDLLNFPSTSNDKNAANSTGLDGHSGQYLENWDAMIIVDDDLLNFPSTSNDKIAVNSTGLDGHLGQYFENVPNPLYDHFRLWDFNDDHELSF